jgi:hypothetical protein
MNSHPCSICGEAGHSSRRCPTLCSPLTPGFYSPPAGHRPSGDDDEHIKLKYKPVFTASISRKQCLKQTLTSVIQPHFVSVTV